MGQGGAGSVVEILEVLEVATRQELVALVVVVDLALVLVVELDLALVAVLALAQVVAIGLVRDLQPRFLFGLAPVLSNLNESTNCLSVLYV